MIHRPQATSEQESGPWTALTDDEHALVDELLLSDGVDRTAMERALDTGPREGIWLGDVLSTAGVASADLIATCHARTLGLSRASRSQVIPRDQPSATPPLPLALARDQMAVILDRESLGLVVGFAAPVRPDQVAAVEQHLGQIVPCVLSRAEYRHLFEATYRSELLDESAHGLAQHSPNESASRVVTGRQGAALFALAGLVALSFVGWPLTTASTVFGLVSLIYFAVLVQRTVLLLISMRRPDSAPTETEEQNVAPLPTYTILVPMFREAAVLPQLVSAIQRFDYPASLLDVKVLLEECDLETIRAARALNLPAHFEIVVVPDGQPQGKPRACNYGLGLARGTYTVIYDAEDVPDPGQLRQALAAFRQSGPDLGCVQARLTFYNPTQNLLTRWFASDYSQWFHGVLPGLVAVGAPIPLGGTSNHFPTAVLRQLGGWDPYNVTEDADLGIRLHVHGFTTAVIESETLEEANPRPGNWIRQRSRWTKGYMQTWLVHMRSPRNLMNRLGVAGFVNFQITLAGSFITQLVNPIFWALAVVWWVTQWPVLTQVMSGFWFYLASFNFFIGNFLLLALTLVTCLRERDFGLVRYMLTLPLYWVLMSVAAWKGFIQLIRNPWYWEKTTHGLAPRAAIPEHTTGSSLTLETE